MNIVVIIIIIIIIAIVIVNVIVKFRCHVLNKRTYTQELSSNTTQKFIDNTS